MNETMNEIVDCLFKLLKPKLDEYFDERDRPKELPWNRIASRGSIGKPDVVQSKAAVAMADPEPVKCEEYWIRPYSEGLSEAIVLPEGYKPMFSAKAKGFFRVIKPLPYDVVSKEIYKIRACFAQFDMNQTAREITDVLKGMNMIEEDE